MKIKIDEKDCLRKDIVIPKGYRIIEDWECLKESRTNKELKRLLIKGYCWANCSDNKIRAVGFVDDGRLFHVYGYYIFGSSDGHSRGVFVKK